MLNRKLLLFFIFLYPFINGKSQISVNQTSNDNKPSVFLDERLALSFKAGFIMESIIYSEKRRFYSMYMKPSLNFSTFLTDNINLYNRFSFPIKLRFPKLVESTSNYSRDQKYPFGMLFKIKYDLGLSISLTEKIDCSLGLTVPVYDFEELRIEINKIIQSDTEYSWDEPYRMTHFNPWGLGINFEVDFWLHENIGVFLYCSREFYSNIIELKRNGFSNTEHTMSNLISVGCNYKF